ncbi:putative ATP-dependent RNA helicase DHR1, partial [Kickxella alabastrina]
MGTNKTKKEKRFEKFVEKQVKKDERATLFEKLGSSTWKSDLMRSSKTLGRKTETQREKLLRAVTEERLGLAQSDQSVRLYVSERDSDDVRIEADKLVRGSAPEVPLHPLGKKRRKKNKSKQKGAAQDADAPEADPTDMTNDALEPVSEIVRNNEPAPESLKRPIESVVAGSALASSKIIKRKRQKKGRILEKLGLVERLEESSEDEQIDESSEFDSSASENESDNEDNVNGDSAIDSTTSEGADLIVQFPVAAKELVK